MRARLASEKLAERILESGGEFTIERRLLVRG